MTQLPPLQSLKAFLMAAHHESFKLAASELHLTPSAVSHQIKGLEDLLGITLFRRHNRQIKLTPAGQMYQKVVNQALTELTSGTDKLQRHFGHNVLRARIPPMIAADYVIPNLSYFQQDNPDIELRLETSLQRVSPERDDIDIMLYFGEPTNNTELVFEKVLPLSVTPIMTPEYYQTHKPSIEELSQHRLIHSSMASDGWQRFFKAFDLEYQPKSSDLWLDSYSSMLQSCCAGHGITLGLLPLLQPRLDQEELVRPYPTDLPIAEAIYLVYRKDRQQSPAINAFNDWITELLKTLILEDFR